ncbi:MAG: thioesterase family protein [Dongiaceae bacterium]
MDDLNLSKEIDVPFVTDHIVVPRDWLDLNGHMNVTYYLRAFDLAFEKMYGQLDFTEAGLERHGRTTFTAEVHITYQRELRLGDRLRITNQLLGFDAKRLHFFQYMYHADQNYLAATCEWLILHIDFRRRKVSPMPDELMAYVARMRRLHAALPEPPEAGRRISLAGKRPG